MNLRIPFQILRADAMLYLIQIKHRSYLIAFAFLICANIYSEEIPYSIFLEKINPPLLYDDSLKIIYIDNSDYKIGDSCTVDYGNYLKEYSFQGITHKNDISHPIWKVVTFDKKEENGERSLVKRNEFIDAYGRLKTPIMILDPQTDKYSIENFDIGGIVIQALVIETQTKPTIKRVKISGDIPTPGIPLERLSEGNPYIRERIVGYVKN